MDRSFNDIRRLVCEALPKPSKTDGYTYIKDIATEWVVWYDSGKYFKASYVIDDNNKVTLGDKTEVVERTVYDPVVMRVFAASADSVEWTGKIFEANDYPDKKASYTESDLDAFVESFEPVELNLEHLGVLYGEATVLDGKLGSLEKIWRTGSELFGLAKVPEWLDTALDKAERKVSVEIDNIAKRITGIALVCTPRVSDAALMAAFKASKSNSPDQGDKSRIADPSAGGKPMTLKERFTALFTGGQVPKDIQEKIEGIIADEQAPIPPETAPAPVTTDPQLAEQVKGYKAQVEAMSTAALAREASAFAEEQIKNQKAVPAQKDHIAAMFTTAIKADAAGKSVFSDTGTLVEGDNVKALKAMFEAQPSHKLLDGVKLHTVDTESTTMSKEREEELLSKTPAGRAALADKKKEGK
jgi:post-segregation antitoxin (ccd killing protein)